MPSKKTLIAATSMLVVVFGFLATRAPAFAADKGKVLHTFGRGNDGIDPMAALIFDAAGNLYGTTAFGQAGCGTIFELTPRGDSTWKEKVLHNFTCYDGANPYAGLIFDVAGNLYGTTSGGPDGYFYGNVFQLSPQADGKWILTVLYSFTGGNDGSYPYGGVIFDGAGNLYGTTGGGGAYGRGTVFQLTPDKDGTWKEKVLHNFADDGKDGFWPDASLTIDASGNLYGMTCCGGSYGPSCSPNDYGCGVVFELTPETNGKWGEKVLHSFNYKDGANPSASLTFDGAGNLYGTTQWGGASGTGCAPVDCGVVFELSPGADGKWKEKVLHRFNGSDGSSPNGNLVFDVAGNLYGTTLFGGPYNSNCYSSSHSCGTVFKLAPGPNGKWTEKVLHSFNVKDGAYPSAGLILDGAGNLYGDTEGGSYGSDCASHGGCGNVFEITP